MPAAGEQNVSEQNSHTRLKRFGAIAALILAVITVVIIFSRGEETVGEPGASLGTTHVTPSPVVTAPLASIADGSVRLVPQGAPSGVVVVTVIEDFLCDACREYAGTFTPALRDLAESGAATVEYVAVTSAAAQSAARAGHGLRLANASLCVATDDQSNWPAFRAALYEQAGTAPSDDAAADSPLIAAAQAHGASHAVDACIREQQYSHHITASTHRWESEVHGELPAILVNGQPIDLANPASLVAAVRVAGVNR
ncbi:DsbA family protein [Hoyosella sp. YIM 151337]|uniref:DsbA family protein n=1 Tax=Hoyosella sp. YIM 151337 TaxID=2992742 RepID=UPI00223677D2|nr:DsbA family protein [Hoyosella sp. YIM 151337]MCW4353062.1 DsbA family protein [Hoyosella sp. YIM 151337]